MFAVFYKVFATFRGLFWGEKKVRKREKNEKKNRACWDTGLAR